MIVCDKCKLTIPPGNAVFDVAVSYQTMPEGGKDELEWNPQYEVYLCSECVTGLVGVLPQWKEELDGGVDIW